MFETPKTNSGDQKCWCYFITYYHLLCSTNKAIFLTPMQHTSQQIALYNAKKTDPLCIYCPVMFKILWKWVSPKELCDKVKLCHNTESNLCPTFIFGAHMWHLFPKVCFTTGLALFSECWCNKHLNLIIFLHITCCFFLFMKIPIYI